MSSYTFSLITDSALVLWYYRSKTPNGKCIIVAIGAPNLIDVDSLRNVEILTSFGYDVIVPEYYWFCRSTWTFTPMNSVQTLIDTNSIAKWDKNMNLIYVYSGESLMMNYSDISFLWLSYGGFAVLVLPKFLPEATKIWAFYPVTDYVSFWNRWVKEETVYDFLASIRRWFSPLYRGIDDPIWEEQFSDALGLSPLFETRFLAWSSIFLAHGTRDDSIYYVKTREYYEKITNEFQDNNIVYLEYQNLGHGASTMLPASYEFCGWLASL